MKLDAKQTRRLLLAGTVPFPKPFPSSGRISIERVRLVYSRSVAKKEWFVVVQEQGKGTLTRFILRVGVAAIFFPGIWVRRARGRRLFKFSRRHAVHNFERGEWFLGPEINISAIRARLRRPRLKLDRRNNPV